LTTPEAVAEQDQVRRLDVAVDEARLGRRLEPARRVERRPRRLHRAHHPVLLHHRAEVDPVEQLHRQVRPLVELPGGEDLHHVRVRDGGHRPGLADEPGPELLVLPVPLREDLDRHVPVEVDVHASHHVAHRALAERADHPVAIDDGPVRELDRHPRQYSPVSRFDRLSNRV
jgi:hypothetical protein